jgi:hypothetical protein
VWILAENGSWFQISLPGCSSLHSFLAALLKRSLNGQPLQFHSAVVSNKSPVEQASFESGTPDNRIPVPFRCLGYVTLSAHCQIRLWGLNRRRVRWRLSPVALWVQDVWAAVKCS